jgi:glycerol-3-phosphate acyltransferase PlsX
VIRIALDAMGGDLAPAAPVAGAVEAFGMFDVPFEVHLVGRTADVEAELAKHDPPPGRVKVIDADEVIGMAERPLQAVRGKRKSSIRIGVEHHKAGEADAFISAGNTGAVMAASRLVLGLHAGVDRPAIGMLMPTQRGTPTLVLDVGANVDCTPRELRGFAHIGSVYARDVLGRENPTVGLLSIGEEKEKGDEAVRAAYEMLVGEQGINFVGNVEGRDILTGTCDVVACDGFVGNVVLKFAETIVHFFVNLLESAVDPDVLGSEQMVKVLRVLDYSETGGAPLLGVRGVCIICHGRSSARAVCSAIGVALRSVSSRLTEHMAAEMVSGGDTV